MRLPVADGELARGELPDHHALARQAILAGSELARERPARRERARVVLRDHVDAAPERQRELRPEPSGRAPAHAARGRTRW